MPALPVVIYGGNLVDYLFEFGPTTEGQPVSFREIESWSRMTRRSLTSWESLTLRLMSQAYAGQAQRSRNPDCLSPLEEGKEPTPSTKLVDKFRALNRSRRSKRGRRV